MSRDVTAIAQWFGGNRILASEYGTALDGCHWVGVVFAGGMSELPHIKARTILVNDLHRHIINLARVIASDTLCPTLLRRLRAVPFHPDALKDAQERCKVISPGDHPDLAAAIDYFVACWIGRSGKAGTDDEFNGRPALRWNSSGGDSKVRYNSAMRMLVTFRRTLRRCTFDTVDGIKFIERCEDRAGHGIYADPPFPGVGLKYKHNAGPDEIDWHRQLAKALNRFERTRVVCRFYEHPLVRELYQEPTWAWRSLVGRKQTNEDAEERLLVLNPCRSGLFE